MATRPSTVLTVKLPAPLAGRLAAAVQKRGITQSELVRQAIEAHLAGTRLRTGSCLDLARDLAGSVPGPRDLSSNRDHLRRFGRR